MPKPPRMTSLLLAVLGFTATVPPLATDMYLASFTDMADDLHAAPATVQLTLTAFLLGIASGQLLLGPLSDQWGRRRVLLTALCLFAATGVAITVAPTIEILIALRLLQGFTGAAGVVIGRAVAADLASGPQLVRALSLMAVVGALGPLIAPPVGGLVAEWTGWRGVFAVLAAVSIAMLAAAWAVVPESLPVENRRTGGLRQTFSQFPPLLRDPRYTLHVAAFGFGFAAMMSFISASPFVGQRVLGMSPPVYGLSFAASAAALILGNAANARVAPRFGPRRVMLIGAVLMVVSAAILLAAVPTPAFGPAVFIASAFGLIGGFALVLGNASALALETTTPSSRGAGAAMLGAAQFTCGAVASPIVGLWGEDTALPMAISMLTAAGLTLTAVLLARRASRR